MSWIEDLLIIAGVSLDLFAAMECQGSLVVKVNKKQLSLICILVAAWQVLALFIGHFLSYLLYEGNPVSNEALLGEILAIAIFFGLGIRLIVKAVKNERIHEHLEEEQDYHRFVKMASVTSLYTVLAGIAFGFMGTSIAMILVMIVIFSVVFVIAGMYTGYHFGFEQKTKVYIIGAVLLWIAGIDAIIRLVV